MALGAYTTAILTYFLHWPLVPALLVGMLVAVLVSVIIGYPTLRAKLRSDYFAIATLGFGEAVKVLLENLSLTQGARGLPGITKLADPVNTALFMLLTVWLCRNFLRSTYGRKIIAIGQDPVAAEMIGIRLLPNQMLSLAISAAFAGLSGGLLAHYTHLHPALDLQHGSLEPADCGGGLRRHGQPDRPVGGDRRCSSSSPSCSAGWRSGAWCCTARSWWSSSTTGRRVCSATKS